MNRSVVRLVLLALAVLMTLASPPIPARGRRYVRHGRSSRGRRGGGRGGYGYGFMQNPYQGYLNGAAAVTTANARYRLTIQQARLLREQARRSALLTRRATLEEAAYERAMRPQAEQLREEQMQKDLERSRHNPPLVEIWSGGALNNLLSDIQKTQTDGLGGLGAADSSLSPDILKHLNVTTGTTYGGIGLLRDGGKLTWPYALRQSKPFDPERKRLDKLLPQAVKQAHAGPVGTALLNNIRSTLKKLEDALDAEVNNLTPGDFTAASRYLREVKDSLQVLEQNDVAKYFSLAWKPKGATVSELVQQMTREGLHFAPAVSGDESYYTSLYRALVNYDLSVAQLTAPLLHTP
ncbi:MAG TPA: hypothetical protein VMG10_23250 [Gemmataceae bacterium]|nr:hypothetical protein [Gemmataceae bacterium]